MAIKTEELMSMGKVKPRRRCPKCKSTQIKRSVVADPDVALYNLYESCRVCPWTSAYLNVRAS